MNSRKGFWGKGAIDAIRERLDKELPGLKGFSARNLRYMRTFYEEWSYLDTYEVLPDTEDGAKTSRIPRFFFLCYWFFSSDIHGGNRWESFV